MTKKLLGSLIALAGLFPPTARAESTQETLLRQGQAALEAKRFHDAIEQFLALLEIQPNHPQAHSLLTKAAQELRHSQEARATELRASLLNSDALPESYRERARVSFAEAQHQRWMELCQQAEGARAAGHLLQAADFYHQILRECPTLSCAGQGLASTQTDIQALLQEGFPSSLAEHFALQGFSAYNQGNAAGAVEAWEKALTLLENLDPLQREALLTSLRFSPHLEEARRRKGEEQRAAQIRDQFEKGSAALAAGRFLEAAEAFRQALRLNPEHSEAALRLARAETELEKQRQAHLSQARRAQIEERFRQALDAYERGNASSAAVFFQEVLRLDPGHAGALSYVALIQTQQERSRNPQQALERYETGLVAYASGRLEEALQEWKTALRMDPQLERARRAVDKVSKELQVSNDMR